MKDNEKEQNIYFRGDIVGKIIAPSVDNFDLYGNWVPVKGKSYKLFKSLLQRGEQVEVVIGEDNEKLKGTVEIEPDDEIEIKIRI